MHLARLRRRSYHAAVVHSSGHTNDGARRGRFKMPRRSVVGEVRRQLLALIESGELKVDERLPSELELARSFGVSRPVIREALVTLHALGVTAARTGRGTFVASNRARLPLLQGRYAPAHLEEIRRHLEVPAARLAAERRTQEDVKRLGEILAMVNEAEDPAYRNKLDARFHIAMAEATGNPLFARLVEDLRAMLEEQSLAVSAVPGRRQQASAEHSALYEAILRRDPRAAADAMAAHLDEVEASLARLEASPGMGGAGDTQHPREREHAEAGGRAGE